MICWADITLPSSRVRSDALRTNLFKRALLGRSVMGTVSGSLGLVFFDLERVGADSATDSLAAGIEDTNTGTGVELVPAGCLAAAAIRAANSLESRFFFMYGLGSDCAMVRNHNTAITQHCKHHAFTNARYYGVLPLWRCNITTLQSCNGTILRHRSVSEPQCHKSILL